MNSEKKIETAASAGKRKKPITAQDLMNAAVKLLDSHRSVSSLSLREIARAAGIAPNSFYRHFRDVDDLAVALIDQAGRSLRGVIREARQRLSLERSAIRTSVEAFMEQLDAEQKTLHILLREMSIGSPAFRQAVDRELRYFEDELCEELTRMAKVTGHATYEPALASKAITRLVFTMGAAAADLPPEERGQIIDETVVMIKMIMEGAQSLAKRSAKK
ncbi:HTH-type transcriptional repressor FabR [Litorivivens sp.]|uniref:HTH-type transcriptional repressor FabR n=1 Tax=Litorivivens sp. TaxID=2020868 RepID=UPI003569312E